VLQIQSPEALQILGFAIQNRQSKIQNRYESLRGTAAQRFTQEVY